MSKRQLAFGVYAPIVLFAMLVAGAYWLPILLFGATVRDGVQFALILALFWAPPFGVGIRFNYQKYKGKPPYPLFAGNKPATLLQRIRAYFLRSALCVFGVVFLIYGSGLVFRFQSYYLGIALLILGEMCFIGFTRMVLQRSPPRWLRFALDATEPGPDSESDR